MPKDKDFKRLIRERMAATGERYTVARRTIERPSSTSTAPPAGETVRRWIELLAQRDQAQAAFHRLKCLEPEQLRPATIAGTTHADWRVRRNCCRLLDDLTLTQASIRALTACLDDPEPRVRQAALHSLSCVHCKPDGCVLDYRPLFERMVQDPNAKVRAGVVGLLAWNQSFVEPWAVRLLETTAGDDPSAKLQGYARRGLTRIERQRATDAARRSLPPDLRQKTERHPGKWVAIVDGRIVTAHWSPGQIRRHTRAFAHETVDIYWVAPESVMV